METHDTVVVGAGQAGLSLSHELTERGIEHVVLERGRIGQSWRSRWDSFCLVTPNWAINLAGWTYDGPDPDGYLPRDEIAQMLEAYAGRIGAPVREGIEVTAVRRAARGFDLETSDGPMRTDRLAIATGAFQRPHRPPVDGLPAGILQVDSGAYRNPDALPAGSVLVVGGGQSGCQIAEELHEAGREVFLACGRAPWVPRRLGGRDIVHWALESGFLDQTVEALPDPRERLVANLQNSGHGGGHDLHYRSLEALGVTLAGRFLGVAGDAFRFAPDLARTMAWGDVRYGMFMDLVRGHVERTGIAMPEIEEVEPWRGESPEEVPMRRFGAVIWALGYRPAYADWLPFPEAYDELGFPVHVDGESVAVPGLHFIGVHFLRKRKSSILLGMAEDAAVVAGRVAGAGG